MLAPLRWTRGNALTEIERQDIVVDLDAGETGILEVDHSADAVFAFATPPEFDKVEGLRIRLLCDGLSGSGFRVEIEVEVGTSGYDYGYGSGKADWTLTWRRRGVIADEMSTIIWGKAT